MYRRASGVARKARRRRNPPAGFPGGATQRATSLAGETPPELASWCTWRPSLLSTSVRLALAIDVGGTKMAAGLVTGEGNVVTSAISPTPAGDDAESLFSVVLALVDSVGGDGEPEVCGVGCGGPMKAHGEAVSPLNIPAWRDFPLRRRLAEATGLPTYVDNDAKALALGEGWRGVAAGEENFIAMVVSTGVGGGIVLDGRLLHGAAGNAGHIGHVVGVPDGRVCVCGGR